MKSSLIFTFAVALLIFNEVHSQNIAQQASQLSLTDKKVGQPHFSLQGAGGGQDLKNWNAGVQTGVGAKVWESQNGRASIGVGFAYQQGFVRHQGQMFTSKPNFGAGVGFRWKF